jgi:HTH-type transcriptional regulator / antitoxin HipB
MCTYLHIGYACARTCTLEGPVRIDNTKDLGAYVRERRRQLDLTQTELANRARVSRRWLSDLEAGKETVDIGLVLRTLRTLNVVVNAQPVEETVTIDLDQVIEDYLRGLS